MSGEYGYTGREWDKETELQYNRARWYDPKTARWLTQDPLGFDAGDTNLYRYVTNRATMAVDPSGLDDFDAMGNRIQRFIVPIVKQIDWDGVKSGRINHSTNTKQNEYFMLSEQKKALEIGLYWARIAASGYLESDSDIDDLQRRYGLKEVQRVNEDGTNGSKNTGLQALVLVDKKGNYIVSFGGTASLKDGVVDGGQGMGYITQQYHNAIQLGQKYQMIAKQKGTSVSFTGHSLGGGTASASAMVTNSFAVTFNAAAVHRFTVEAYDKKISNEKIISFRVKKEPLSTTQRVMPDLLMPNNNGVEISIESNLWSIDPRRHCMPPLIAKWEKDLHQINMRLILGNMDSGQLRTLIK